LIVGIFGVSVVAGASASAGSAVAVWWMPPPVVAGMVILLLVVAAIRSGSRGGPIPLEAGLVFLVLMAPLDRGLVLRQPALRQVVVGVAVGAAVAAVVGLVAGPWLAEFRLGSWAVAGALCGALAVGVSLTVAGVRLRPAAWVAAQVLVGLWWLADAAAGVATSPVAALAQVPFRPLSVGVLAYPAAGAALAVAVGLVRVGHVSLERAWQRSRSADQLRVAVGLNDLRTALLILRRRSQERSRSKPWCRLPGLGGPIFRRGAHAVLRWPAGRIVRFGILAVIVGLATPAAAVAPAGWVLVVVVLYLAGLDAIDALAEELDHADLLRLYPIRAGAVLLRHLPVPAVVLVGFTALSTAVAWAVTSSSDVALLGGGLMVPTAIAVVAGASLTASRVARPFTKYSDIGMPAEVVAPRIILRLVAPLLPIALTVVPTIITFADGAPVGSALLAAIPGLLASTATIAWSTNGDARRALPARVTALVVRRTVAGAPNARTEVRDDGSREQH
jgi:hypothetical protein